MSKLYTTAEAATYLGVSTARVRQLIAEKRIMAEKLGRDHIINEISLIAFSEAGKKKRGRPKLQE